MVTNKEKVFVGISGGVDSSVSLALLKEQGYDVTGVFIKVWYPDWLQGCDWRSERRDAMRVCAELGVPFLTLDLEQVYKQEVVDYLIETYRRGETPNPDVMCNRYIKFGAFWDFAEKHGAHYIATGHYAQNIEKDGVYRLRKGVDQDKDQTYFLYTLTQKDLEHVLFPIGEYKKEYVRTRAEKYNLPTAQKKDSQGLCFLGDVTIKDLLRHYVDLKKGNVLDEEGTIIGEHDGALLYTRGQRHGFRLFNKKTNSKPYYVISKDIEKNIIIVSLKEKTYQKITSLELHHVTYTSNEDLGGTITCNVRYHGKDLPCRLEETGGGTARVLFNEDISKEFPARGQSVVLYKKEICLGGGVIKDH